MICNVLVLASNKSTHEQTRKHLINSLQILTDIPEAFRPQLSGVDESEEMQVDNNNSNVNYLEHKTNQGELLSVLYMLSSQLSEPSITNLCETLIRSCDQEPFYSCLCTLIEKLEREHEFFKYLLGTATKSGEKKFLTFFEIESSKLFYRNFV